MNKLKTLRKAKGLSQSQLAAKSGVPFRMLQSYEQGRHDFDHARLDRILAMCLALDCKLSDIITDEKILHDLDIVEK